MIKTEAKRWLEKRALGVLGDSTDREMARHIIGAINKQMVREHRRQRSIQRWTRWFTDR